MTPAQLCEKMGLPVPLEKLLEDLDRAATQMTVPEFLESVVGEDYGKKFGQMWTTVKTALGQVSGSLSLTLTKDGLARGFVSSVSFGELAPFTCVLELSDEKKLTPQAHPDISGITVSTDASGNLVISGMPADTRVRADVFGAWHAYEKDGAYRESGDFSCIRVPATRIDTADYLIENYLTIDEDSVTVNGAIRKVASLIIRAEVSPSGSSGPSSDVYADYEMVIFISLVLPDGTTLVLTSPICLGGEGELILSAPDAG